jgi:aspartate/methionine/tyrosine aminotransferase
MNFSGRISWGVERNRIARAIESRRGELLDLTQSNPTQAGIEYQVQAILDALTDPRVLQYDPTPVGLPVAREAVSQYYDGRVDPGNVVLTASTSEAYSYLFKLLCDPGDEILVPRPSYPLFEFLAGIESVRVLHYPMHYHDRWYIDTHALEQAVTERTRAVVFVNPNNPTGSFLKQHEFEFLEEMCSSRRMALIVDEVFADYALTPDASRVATTALADAALTFTLSGLSKVCGLPQMKLGWIVASGLEELRRPSLERLELIADTFLSAGTPVQVAAPALLEMRHGVQEQIRARTCSNLAYLRSALAQTSGSVLDVEAGWYATVQAPRVRSEEEWVLRLIEERGVLVQPGFFFDFEQEAFLIVSLLTEPPEFRAGVDALAAELY